MSGLNVTELLAKKISASEKVLQADNENNEDPNTIEKGASPAKPKGICEEDCGITEYLGKHKGFNGVIKQRFSDFQVHEIDEDGNIARLTSTALPQGFVPCQGDSTVLDADAWGQLDKLAAHLLDLVEIDVTGMSKEKRTDAHLAIKARLGTKVTSNTCDRGDKKFLIVHRGKSNRTEWPKGLGQYLHFVLFKMNLDTTDALEIIASKLKCMSSFMAYAGTKDKRGKTSQWVSMRYLKAERLLAANPSMRSLRVGNFVYKSTPLKLGNLLGNHFEIVLRNITASDEVIQECFTSLKENGFINYYGLQRFGNSPEVPTHMIGRALVKGNFKTAVELILKPRFDKSYTDLKQARKVWWDTRNADKAFNILRRKDRSIEGKLLQGLVKHGKNAYINALECIPRNIRLMYLHSYQSYLWNSVLSRRIHEFGVSVLEGDLVLSKKEKEDTEENDEDLTKSNLPSVRILKKEEVGDYKITDIVHPLPGHAVTYPHNVLQHWYDDLLADDNLSSEQLNQTVKQFALSGAYRHIVKHVRNLSYRITHYSDPEQDLVLSDLDKLENVGPPGAVLGDEEGQFKALILEFALDSSTYATMVLREVLKVDTSKAHQVSLNTYYAAKRSTTEDATTGGQTEQPENKKIKVGESIKEETEPEAAPGSLTSVLTVPIKTE